MTESQYYILYDDGTKSIPYNFEALSHVKRINKRTLIVKDNEAPKLAGAFIDFTDNRLNPSSEELNTFNMGAYAFPDFWGYIHFPKYRIYWGAYIIISFILMYFYMETFFQQAYTIKTIIFKLLSTLFLIKGNEIAWKNRRFRNTAEFKAVQKKWFIWGCWVYGIIGSSALILVISYGINN